jgi:hypothetical protein
MTAGLNSSAPTTAFFVGGVYNSTPPTLVPGQVGGFQLDANGNLLTTLSVGGNPPSLAHPIPVELSDGTNAFGTTTNPISAAASAETSTVFNGNTALTPMFSTIVASSSGATTIVAAVTSKKIRVLALQLIANAAVNVKWQSHVTPTDLTGLAYMAANGGYVLPFNPVGWFQTVSGEALDINLSGAFAVGGSLTYVAV